MDRSPAIHTVGCCEAQPLTAEGLKAVLAQTEDFQWAWAAHSLDTGRQLADLRPPSLLVVDKSFGMQGVLEWVLELRSRPAPAVVVWGLSISEAEALRFLQAGAKGVIRKSAEVVTILMCLRTVATGSTWIEDLLFRGAARRERTHRSELTPREQQVLELVEQGLKNSEIARELGIRPGTVKIHLKHIFEKTGVRGRYGLALSNLRDGRLTAWRQM
ncbi:MAG: response regulator transcription factor [Bryobacterales bacterium]|nr:response regulator transcription factor [Bryobacteraceae bacterium]MDW8354506.1 response regulator transcription factor [Bryobacterales bacterium]